MNITLNPPIAMLGGRTGIDLIPVRDRLWRVARAGGAVLGHIEAIPDPRGERFQARRLLTGGINSIELGTFWLADDAVDCFR